MGWSRSSQTRRYLYNDVGEVIVFCGRRGRLLSKMMRITFNLKVLNIL